MKLESIHIHQNWRKPGNFTGTIKFSNEMGEMTYNIDADFSQELINLCADRLLTMAKRAASEMQAKVVLDVQALPAPAAE